jgi:hypothetical protein
MGCDRGTDLSVLWIRLHPVQLRSHAAWNAALGLVEAIGHLAVGAMRRRALFIRSPRPRAA